jgi:hypothetical protein
MRTQLLVMGIGLAISGCATNAPQMAWGKPGVTKVDYGTDVGMCSGLAAMQTSGNNGANSAGGISGSNNTVNTAPGPSGANTSNAASAAAAGGPPISAAASSPVPAGGSYSGMASADFAQRAATQQRAQEMAVQRARSDALRTCLTERGYQQFGLTAEQRAHLATLKKGSTEYHEYLYQLGSDAEIIGKQSRTASGK